MAYPRPSLADGRQHSHRKLYSTEDAAEPLSKFGPLVSISKRPGLAADAAAQQAFHEKQWVWVADATKGYVSSWVVKSGQDSSECMGVDDKIRTVGKNDLSKQNPPKFDQVEDMAELTHLNEASVVHNLERRFKHDRIYTYSGPFLVAVNPYRNLDAYYSPSAVNQYMNRRREENPPHIFAIAQQSWAQMISERESQSILVTGESGAGKTENTKKVIQFLTAIAADASSILPSSGSAETLAQTEAMGSLSRQNSQSRDNTAATKRLGKLEHQILQANPILEAFGNAQTVRNNNSSRFGKFVRIEFTADGAIAGAFIDWYLLEKSRVTSRSEKERSFHVFYQLLRGAPAQLKRDLLLDRPPEEYGYLSLSSNTVDGMDDQAEWAHLQKAFDIVGFSRKEQTDIFKNVAAILHLGNLNITGRDRAAIENPAELEKAAHLLNLPIKDFTSALLQPRTKAGREWVTQARSPSQVVDEIASVCKTLYEKTFGSIVDRINQALDRPTAKSTFIGVLDIAGFEIFERNSFEQLCINYTNEKLQQFFNHHMFVLEQEEYEREEIGWQFENFGLDLQPTIELIESSQPIGILACLDEECIMPKASDETFTDKLKQMYLQPNGASKKDSPKFSANLYDKLKFTVQHYAGKVDYETQDWLVKNKDPLNDNLTTVLSQSGDVFIASLFAEFGEAANAGRRATVKRGAFRTVGQRHKEQLTTLMTQLQCTSPHFVRCIVPNSNKRPSVIDTPLVLDQLRCNGVLEGIRIARLGYPNRLPFVDFRHRYEVLTPGILAKGYVDGRIACQKMLSALQLDPSLCKVGRSKAFFKAGVLAELEERRDELLYGIFSRMQAACRRFTARRSLLKVLNRAMAARTIQRNARIYLELKQWPWWGLYTKVRPLLAATRADDELRRKEAELAAAKERETREFAERERLAKLQLESAAKQKELEETLKKELAARQTADEQIARFLERERILQENLDGAESDIDRLLATNEEQTRAIESLQASYQTLGQSFKTATDHLERLEEEAAKWESTQSNLGAVKSQHAATIQGMEEQQRELGSEVQALKSDLSRAKSDAQRSEKILRAEVDTLTSRNADLAKTHESLQAKLQDLESEHNTVQAQVSTLSQASQDYTDIMQKKDEEIAHHVKALAVHRQQSSTSSRENGELRKELALLRKEQESRTAEIDQAIQQRADAQSQLTKLQTALALKVSEDKQREEGSRRLDEQLQTLQRQNADLTARLNSAISDAAQQVVTLKSQVELATRERDAAKSDHTEQQEQIKSTAKRVVELEAALATVERRSATQDADFQSMQARQLELDQAAIRLREQKETDDRALSTLKNRLLQVEAQLSEQSREHQTLQDQNQKLKSALDLQISDRARNEETHRRAQREVQDAQQRLKRQERVAIDLQSQVEAMTHELEQSRTLENKTTIEHVHTLQEAMKVQDRQLAEAQRQIEQNQTDFRNLDKVRARLQADLQDARFQTQQDTSSARTDTQRTARLEQNVLDLKGKLDLERRAREAADQTATKAKSELRGIQSQFQSLTERVEYAEKAKSALEKELRAFSQKPTSPTYQTFANLGNSQSAGRKQILDQLARNTSDLTDQMGARLDSLSNANPSAKSNGRFGHATKRGASVDLSSSASKVGQTAEIQLMLIDKAIADRVRQGLERQVTDMRQILSDASRSKISPSDLAARLDKENLKLQALLQQEASARQDAEAARLQGSEALHAYHLKVKASLDDRFAGLEQSRTALQAVQRQLTTENESLHKQLDAAVSDLKQNAQRSAQTEMQFDRLRNDHRQALDELEALREQIHTVEIGSGSDKWEHQLAAVQRESDSLRDTLEASRIREEKAVKAQTFASMALAEAEKTKNEAVEDREAAENRARLAEARCRELEALTADGTSRYALASLERDCVRLQEDLEAERKQRVRSENDSDARVHALQKGYQSQLEQLNNEFTDKQDELAHIRAERDHLRTAHDELQIRLDDEVYSMSAWKHEKETLTDNWSRAKKAFDDAVQRQAESQAKNVELVQENRDIRMKMEDYRSERNSIAQAKKALEERLQELSRHSPTGNQAYSGAVELERDDLRKELESAKTSLAMAQARQTSAERLANEQQRNAAREREEAGKVANVNNDLHRQVKDLQVRLANHEARSVAASPRPTSMRNTDGRLAELMQELQEERRLRTSATENAQTKEFQLKDAGARLQDEAQRRKRLEQDRDADQNQILALRREVAETRNAESAAKSEASKAAREAQSISRDADRKLEQLRLENASLMKRLELGRSSTIGSLSNRGSSPSLMTNRDREAPVAPPRRRPF